MKNIQIVKTHRVMLRYIIKMLVTTAVCIGGLIYLLSNVILKLDLSVDFIPLMTVGIVVITSVAVSGISVYGFKNNGVLMGIISNIPLIIYCVYNYFAHHNSLVLLLIKLVLCVLLSAVTGYITVRKRNRFKV